MGVQHVARAGNEWTSPRAPGARHATLHATLAYNL